MIDLVIIKQLLLLIGCNVKWKQRMHTIGLDYSDFHAHDSFILRLYGLSR